MDHSVEDAHLEWGGSFGCRTVVSDLFLKKTKMLKKRKPLTLDIIFSQWGKGRGLAALTLHSYASVLQL